MLIEGDLYKISGSAVVDSVREVSIEKRLLLGGVRAMGIAEC